MITYENKESGDKNSKKKKKSASLRTFKAHILFYLHFFIKY